MSRSPRAERDHASRCCRVGLVPRLDETEVLVGTAMNSVRRSRANDSHTRAASKVGWRTQAAPGRARSRAR